MAIMFLGIMMIKMIMHPTTYEYISKEVQNGKKLKDSTGPIFAFISQYGVSFFGYSIELSFSMKSTIMEPEWVFPKSKFVKYEYSDLEWCKFFGIGRPGIQQVGDILAYYTTPIGKQFIKVGF